MAAGEGTRLRPVSERWAKPVLPIDGRPVVVTLLRALAEAGIERAWVVVGHLGHQVHALADGVGPEVRFVDQPSADGSADAVKRALDAGAEPSTLVTAADTVFADGDLARFLAAADGYDGAIAGRRIPPPSPPHRSPLGIRDGLVQTSTPRTGSPARLCGRSARSSRRGSARTGSRTSLRTRSRPRSTRARASRASRSAPPAT
jgi:NDP-sugar pyrophosphorylase family protein